MSHNPQIKLPFKSLETPEGHRKLCYYCNKECNSFAGDPAQWPIGFLHKEEPGKLKWHHSGCVTDRLNYLEKLKDTIIEMAAQAAFIRLRCGMDNPELWDDAGKIVITAKEVLKTYDENFGAKS
jgi:hypothetical protein